MTDPAAAPAAQLWTVEQVAHYLNVKARTVYDYVYNRDLPSLKVGGSLRFRPAEIEAWIEQQND